MVERRLGKTNWSTFRHGRANGTKLLSNVSGRRTFRARGIYQDLESGPGEDRGRPPENETGRRRREGKTVNENENTTKLELRTIDRIVHRSHEVPMAIEGCSNDKLSVSPCA